MRTPPLPSGFEGPGAPEVAQSVREISPSVTRRVAPADIAAMPLLLNVAKMELEGGAPPPTAPEAKGSAVGDTFFLDDEKIVWHLPDLGSRLIEDPR